MAVSVSYKKTMTRVNILLAVVVLFNIVLWQATHKSYVKWEGVPPVPTKAGAMMMSLGDPQFSYRFTASVLQALGDGGGHYAPLKDYDYQELGKWFWLLHDLDPASNHVPMVAAYYFGSTRVPKDAEVVADYLGVIGQNPAGNKWRWLAQAVFLERYRAHNQEKALDMAYALARMNPIGDTLPAWARHMPVFVLRDMGEKESAREMLENILLTGDLHKNESTFIYYFLIEQLGVSKADVDALMKKRAAGGKEILPDDPSEVQLPPLEP